MIYTRIVRLVQSPLIVARPSTRLIHNTPLAATAPGRDSSLSQGNVAKKDHLHSGDAQDQAARSGLSKNDKSPHDAASQHPGKNAPREGLSGNKENVGFAEQVGSASSGQRASEGKGGQEESTPPSLLSALKSKMGFNTSSGEVKQNRGGGKGVTGTGTFPGSKNSQERRQMHTSAAAWVDPTKGQAPDASRKPKDRTYSEQNEHLSHRSETDPAAFKGKGNAAEQPSLPSHKFNDKKTPSGSQQRRTFYTSARRLAEKHTADSYFKDVDNSPPESSKTYQVDPATGAKVSRPNEPDIEGVGAETKEYETVSKDKPYETVPTKGKESEEKLRYGGMGGTGSRSGGQSVSKSNEGPEGASAGGHHAEGR